MFSRLRQSSNNGESQNVGNGGGYGNNSNAYASNTQSNPNNYNSNSNSNTTSSNSYGSSGNTNSNSYESPHSSNNNSSSYGNSNSNSNSNSYDNYSSGNGHNRTGSNTETKNNHNNNSNNNNNNNNKISNNSQQTGYGNDQNRKEPSEAGQSTASSLFSSSNVGAQSNVSAATSVSSGRGNTSNNGKGSPKKPSYSQLGSKMDTIQDEGNNVGTNTYGSSTVNNDRETTSARRETLYEDANEHLGNNVSGNNKQSVNHTSNTTQNIQSWQQTSAHATTKGTTNGNNTSSGRDTASNSGIASKAAYSSSNNGKNSNDTHQGNQKSSRETASHNNAANNYGNNQSSMAGNQSSSYGNSKNESNIAHGNNNASNKSTGKNQRNLSSSGRSNSGKSASGRSNNGKGGRNSPRQNDQHGGGGKGATTYNSDGTAQHLDLHARTSSNTGYGSSTTSHNSTGNRNTNNSQDPIAQAGDFNDPNADIVFLSSESGSGSTRSPVVRFRIHSVNLRVHSPVLTKNVEQETKQEHQLEEDAATLKHLFSLMYNRDSPILEPNDWQMVLRLARCAQKYDVVRAKERAIAYFTKNEQSGALSPFMTYAFAVQYNLPTLEAAAAERSVRYDVNKIPELIFNMMGFTAFQRLASFHAKRQEYYQDMLNALSIDPKEVADQCYQTGGVCVVTPLARLKQTLAWPRQVGRDATKRAPEPADVLRKIITEIGQIDCGTCAKALVEAGLAIQHTLETLPSYSHDESS